MATRAEGAALLRLRDAPLRLSVTLRHVSMFRMAVIVHTVTQLIVELPPGHMTTHHLYCPVCWYWEYHELRTVTGNVAECTSWPLNLDSLMVDRRAWIAIRTIGIADQN